MQKRTLGRLGAIAVATSTLAIAACYGKFDGSPDDAGGGDGGSADATSTSDTSTPSPDAPVVIEDGAIEEDASEWGEDSGIDPNPPPIDGGKAFDFAAPYAAALGASSRSDAGHNFANNNPKN